MTIWNFICPDCGDVGLEEVMENVILAQPLEINVLEESETILVRIDEEKDITIHDGFTNRFQCENCGWIICDEHGVPIRDYEDLEDWIRSRAL